MFFSINIFDQVRVNKNPIDEQVADLHREATKLKGKDWKGAIALLQQAAKLDEQHGLWMDAARMVRLPIFMQQGGQFIDALAEFEKLIKRVPMQAAQCFPQLTALHKRAICHRQSALIYDKQLIACKREKRADLAQDAKLRHDIHRAALEALEPLLEAEELREQKARDVRLKRRNEK